MVLDGSHAAVAVAVAGGVAVTVQAAVAEAVAVTATRLLPRKGGVWVGVAWAAWERPEVARRRAEFGRGVDVAVAGRLLLAGVAGLDGRRERRGNGTGRAGRPAATARRATPRPAPSASAAVAGRDGAAPSGSQEMSVAKSCVLLRDRVFLLGESWVCCLNCVKSCSSCWYWLSRPRVLGPLSTPAASGRKLGREGGGSVRQEAGQGGRGERQAGSWAGRGERGVQGVGSGCRVLDRGTGWMGKGTGCWVGVQSAG